MTRFLFVSDFEPQRASGAAGSLISIAEALETLGHSVDLVWRPQELAGKGSTFDRFLRLDQRQTRQVSHALSQGKHDVVIVSQPYAFGVYEWLPRRYPGVLFLNRTHGWEARVYAQQRRFRWDEGRRWPGRISSRVGEALTFRACARTARAAQGIITACGADAAFLHGVHCVPRERVTVIPHGRDTTPSGEPNTRGSGRMLFVGNWVPLKGSRILEQVLPAVAIRHPDARLTIVTEAHAHRRLRSLLGPSFGERLTVRPWLSRNELNTAYASHDLLLFPSLFEGFGKVWLEAMGAGMCVVGFSAGGLPDIARDGQEALVVPEGDVYGLLGRLGRALADPSLALRLGTDGAARVAAYTWTRAAAGTLAFCNALRVARA
jgi:glycosyltransferase involved in cell wall biosynthesis